MSINSVGIVGCRNYDNYNNFERIINQWIVENGNIDQIVSGGCSGVDTFAEKYAQQYNIPTKIFKPDYKKYGKSATHIRNAEIVKHSKHLIAMPSKTSVGTLSTIKIAKSKNIPITEIPIY